MTSFSVAFWKQNKDNRTQSRALGKRKGIPTKDNTDAEGSFWAVRKSPGMNFSSKLQNLHCTWNWLKQGIQLWQSQNLSLAPHFILFAPYTKICRCIMSKPVKFYVSNRFPCSLKSLFCLLFKVNRNDEYMNFQSIHPSGKLPTYPSPNPTFCPKWDTNVNVESGEG